MPTTVTPVIGLLDRTVRLSVAWAPRRTSRPAALPLADISVSATTLSTASRVVVGPTSKDRTDPKRLWNLQGNWVGPTQ